MSEWHVQALTAVDRRGRVVRDDFRLLVLDQRDKRIAGYRLRWYVDGYGNQHSRTFKRNQLDEALRLRTKLLDAAADAVPAGADGLPRETPPPPVATAAASGRSLLDDLRWAQHAYAAKVATNTRTGYRSTVDFVEYLAKSDDFPGLYPEIKTCDLTAEICQDILMARRGRNLRYPGQGTSPNTEERFSTYFNKLLCIIVSRGSLPANPWDAAKNLVRSAPQVVLSDRTVASQERVVDIADAIAEIPGGERFACPVRTAGREAPRPGEMRGVDATSFRDRATADPFMRLEINRPIVSKKDEPNGVRMPVEPLKNREPGDHRDVPLFVGVLDDVEDHLARFCGDGQPFFAFSNGQIPDASSWLKKYWDPAVERVLGDSPEPSLRNMEFRQLRHSAITWWLSAGASPQQAAAWAGNSPEVLLQHYAGLLDNRSIPANPDVRRKLFGEAEVTS